ncbi:MAG: hypothetical protein CM15mP46_3030 [Alphaproteobacteria bacterium]|nr:MAG: hypothetical protein CM15mP46_3030 [Alphaproteobacteria bacterium]
MTAAARKFHDPCNNVLAIGFFTTTIILAILAGYTTEPASIVDEVCNKTRTAIGPKCANRSIATDLTLSFDRVIAPDRPPVGIAGVLQCQGINFILFAHERIFGLTNSALFG